MISGVGVVSFRNPIHSALALVANLLSVAGLFALLDAHFLAAVQIIVYAGAIIVLVVFVLMLLNIKVEPVNKISPTFALSSVLTGALFLLIIVPLLNQAFRAFPDPKQPIEGTMEAMGKIVYTKYLFPFEAASVLIMAAIVGAVMLAKKKGRLG